MNDSKIEAQQDSVANLIVGYATSLAERTEKLFDKTNIKLGPVMVSQRPTPADCKEQKQPREYPPFFEELRKQLQRIEDSLYGIENALSRTEL